MGAGKGGKVCRAREGRSTLLYPRGGIAETHTRPLPIRPLLIPRPSSWWCSTWPRAASRCWPRRDGSGSTDRRRRLAMHRYGRCGTYRALQSSRGGRRGGGVRCIGLGGAGPSPSPLPLPPGHLTISYTPSSLCYSHSPENMDSSGPTASPCTLDPNLLPPPPHAGASPADLLYCLHGHSQQQLRDPKQVF